MSYLTIKIEEHEKMKEFIKVMLNFTENKKIVEAFQLFEKQIEKDTVSSLNTEFIMKIQELFNSVFGSGFHRNNDEYYRYLNYYNSQNKETINNDIFTEDGWIHFFQHYIFKNLQKHISKSFNNDIKKINKDLPKWLNGR